MMTREFNEKPIKHITAILLAICIFITGCNPQAGNPVPPTSENTASATLPELPPTPTLANTPTVTLTTTPSFTNTPTATPTMTPTPTQEPITAENSNRLERYTVLGHGVVMQAAVSPDYKTIAVASTIGVLFYDVETLERIGLLEPVQTAHSLAFSPDGTKLAIGMPHPLILEADEERIPAVEVWDLQSGSRIQRFEGYSQFWDIRSLAFSPDGCEVIDLSDTVHNICDGSTTKKSSQDKPAPAGLLSPNGRIIARYKGSRVSLVDAATYQEQAKIDIGAEIMKLTYSPDGEKLALFAADWKIHLLSTETGELQGVSEALSYVPIAITFSADSLHLTVIDDYINLYRWNTQEWALEKTRTELPMKSHGAFSNDGKFLAVASDGYTRNSGKYFEPGVVVLDANTLEQVYLLEGGHDPKSYIGGLAFSPDGKTLASTDSYIGIVNLWDMQTGNLLKKLEVMPGKRLKEMDLIGCLRGVAFSPDGSTVAAVSAASNRLYTWDIETGELTRGFTLPSFPLPNGRSIGALHPDGVTFESRSLVVLNSSSSTFLTWDLDQSEWTGSSSWNRPVANATKTLFVYPGGCLHYWSATEVENKTPGKFCVSSVGSFSPGSTLWIVASGKLYSHKYKFSTDDEFAFNPRGTVLMQASPAGVITLWRIKPR